MSISSNISCINSLHHSFAIRQLRKCVCIVSFIDDVCSSSQLIQFAVDTATRLCNNNTSLQCTNEYKSMRWCIRYAIAIMSSTLVTINQHTLFVTLFELITTVVASSSRRIIDRVIDLVHRRDVIRS